MSHNRIATIIDELGSNNSASRINDLAAVYDEHDATAAATASAPSAGVVMVPGGFAAAPFGFFNPMAFAFYYAAQLAQWHAIQQQQQQQWQRQRQPQPPAAPSAVPSADVVGPFWLYN